MRVLHVLNDITTAGNGIVNSAVDIAWGQARLGHSVAVASAGGGYEVLLASAGVGHYPLLQRRRPLSMIQAGLQFRRIIAEYQPDIVHCHMVTGSILAWALRGMHRYRLVTHVHNIHQPSSFLMRIADRVIASSDGVAEWMSRRGIPRKKMRVVRYRTLGSPRLPSLDQVVPANLRQPAIVTVAGMYKRKGIAELIRAFQLIAPKFPDANLYLVGDGPDKAEFERQARASLVSDRVHFEGFRSNPQEYMRAARIFVLASHRESFGLVLLEAREAGSAIVASDVDGIPEALDDGAAGILVPPGDPEELARAFSLLLSDEKSYDYWRRQAGQNLGQFGLAKMVDQVDSVYSELLRGRPAAGAMASAGMA